MVSSCRGRRNSLLYSCWKSNQLVFVAGAQKGRGGGGGWRIGYRSARQCYSDMGIPIPKTLVIWAFSSHITLAIWVRDRVVQGMPISLGFWEWGCPKRVMPMSLWHRGGGGEPPPSPASVPRNLPCENPLPLSNACHAGSNNKPFPSCLSPKTRVSAKPLGYEVASGAHNPVLVSRRRHGPLYF